MMATEATSEIIAPSTPDHELNPTETKQDVSEILVNGEKDGGHQQDTEPVDSTINNVSAEVSVSGGSDTEGKATETTKTETGEEKGHTRTASTTVKKFASFKPVSVNKTFLAAKAAAPTKLGDKVPTAAPAGPSASAASRPRLVAKSGSGLREVPRTSTTANGKTGAPDASVVWNKNRPAPPPEPKRFTDEELKQQYGIHLATRLQSDDAGKQANWADIDDDDDDWAPETIEWTDGTKITLPQADDTPAPREPSPIPAIEKAKTVEAIKPQSPGPTQAAASPTARPSGFGGRTGLILKGATEKPTLVAKPPGPPTPVKSPWASLPPVDKVVPIAIDIPQNQQLQQNRFSQRDPHGFQGMPPPPAKEIAADDFSRSSWRAESHGNTSRTLFNSQSGGYEPVNDNRRGSRNDHSRQPAVLQRPAQADGPAEPSPAFQTHRAHGQDPSYGRRRTSSNVSGGSGNFIRRMSRGHDMPPPHEMLAARRGSLAAVSDAPSSPRNFSPSGHSNQRGYQNQQWQSRASPVVSHPSPQSIAGQPIPPSGEEQGHPVPPFEDPLEEQKKIMRGKRELAIKRRQEEEAKEEAARKERIRLKLEAMGPPPEKKKDKKDAVKEEKPIPTQIQTRDNAKTEAEGEPKLSNLGKVEPEHSPASVEAVAQPTDRSPNSDLRPNGLNKGTSSMAPTRQGPQEGRSWQNPSASAADRYQTWAPPSTQQAPSRNVWGPPPSNERPLGNGTFNPDLSRLPESQTSSSHPGPIGPPGRGNSQYQQGGRGREYGSRPAPIGPPTRQTGASQEQDARVAASGWTSLPDKLAKEDAQFRQQQDSELARKRELQANGLLAEEAQPEYKDTWRQVTLKEDGTRSKIVASTTNINDASGQWKPHEERPDRRQLDADIAQPHFNDTWKSSAITPSTQARGSRFFPNNNRDARLEEQNAPYDRPGSPSPPPPTMAGHPAYDGDTAHPHVSLPRPSPVVKLPPVVIAPIGPPKPASFAAAVTAPPPQALTPAAQTHFGHNSQDIRNTPVGEGEDWQARISSLLGRNPKQVVMAVDSSSKFALELPTSKSFATVSLPSSVSGDLALDDSSVTSKPAAEECFPEQEMGSLPPVKVPSQAPANGWALAKVPLPPSKGELERTKKFEVSTSRESYKFEQTHTTEDREDKTRRPAYYILLPGQENKVIVRVNNRQRSNPKPRGNRNATPRVTSSGQRGGRGGRDTSSSSFPSPSNDSASVSSTPNSRGGQRGRGNGGNRGNRNNNNNDGGNGRGYDWARHAAPIAG